jgi:23S rRNA (guanosine2251-2'-O)-methyltransferase
MSNHSGPSKRHRYGDKRPARDSRDGKPDRQFQRRDDKPETLWIYGRHAVAAALANPQRRIRRLVATRNAADWLTERGLTRAADDLKPHEIDRLLQPGAVHQGLAAEVDDLPRARLKDVCVSDGDMRPVVVLDQITDPQNIGAVFRSAAAFGARAIIVHERRTPPLAGALAKAAAGAIETLPCVKAVNISRALEALTELGYHCAGLAGEAELAIGAMPKTMPAAIVLGAEGDGLRQGVAANCSALYRIPIRPGVESLNVSNAAAIALYEAVRHMEASK